MANAQPIRVDIIGNARGLSASVDLANAKLSTMTGVAAKASAATDRLQTNMNRINVAMGVAAGVAGAGFVFKNLAQSAGDAQTATRSLEAVFKGSTAQMQEAATAGEQLGLSFTAYGQNATRLGAQLQNMGFDTQGAADATENLLQHAADLSSVYGGSVTQAVEAMSAVFRKELDPIEKYGVTLKAAAIQARADSEGITLRSGRDQGDHGADRVRGGRVQPERRHLQRASAEDGGCQRERESEVGVGAAASVLRVHVGRHPSAER